MRTLLLCLLLAWPACAQENWRKFLSPHAQKEMKNMGQTEWSPPQLTSQEKHELKQLWELIQKAPPPTPLQPPVQDRPASPASEGKK